MENKKIKKLAIIIGVLLLPLIYSVTYLEGFWDPYNNLGNIKVAVVNEDNCTKDCKSTDLIKELQDSNTFDFTEKDKDDAEEGLLNKKYYATITIPEDFTKSLENVDSADRKAPTITYRTNKKTNYIASQLIENAVIRVEGKLDNKIATEIVKTLSDKLNEVPEQTEKIEDALDKIYTGTVSLDSGASKLKDGTNKLDTNSKKITEGINNLNNGINELSNGTTSLKAGAKQLQTGITSAKAGTKAIIDNIGDENTSETLKQGTKGLANGLETYNASATAAYSALDGYLQVAQTRQLTSDEVTAIKGYITQLKTSTIALEAGAKKVDGGVDTLLTYLNIINQGLSELEEGSNSLVNGIDRLDSGVKAIYNGSNTLNTNYKTFNNGVSTLNDSVSTLKDGTNTLEEGAKTAKDAVKDATDNTKEQLKALDGLDDYTEEPVKFKDNSYGVVDDYGTFFSPFFMSLSLWLGGILIIMGLYYDPEHRFAVLGKNSTNRPKRLAYYTVIGIAQSIILPIILVLCLHFTVTNWFLFFASCILIGLSFLSIMLFLVFNFDDIGKFLAIVLLVIQLAACAGTFPLETEPSFFQDISPFMPMTYSVELLRESFVSIDSSLLSKDIFILTAILVVFGTLIFVTGLMKTKKEKLMKKASK